MTKSEFKICYDAGNCGHSLPLIGGLISGMSHAMNTAYGASEELKSHHTIRAKEITAQSSKPEAPEKASQALSPKREARPWFESASSADIPIWVYPLVAVVTICLVLLCLMAVAPFFFHRKTKRTTSMDTEAEAADLEHDQAYENLGVIDGPEQSGPQVSGVSLSGMLPPIVPRQGALVTPVGSGSLTGSTKPLLLP